MTPHDWALFRYTGSDWSQYCCTACGAVCTVTPLHNGRTGECPTPDYPIDHPEDPRDELPAP